MGNEACAPEVGTEPCGPQCSRVVPCAVGGSELERRRLAMQMRRKHSVSFAMKRKTLAEAGLPTDDPKEAEGGDKEAANDYGAFGKRSDEPSQVNLELLRGASRGDLRRVQRALAANADVSNRNDRGISPMMLAASSGGQDAVEVLQELLKRKASFEEEPDSNGWNALHHACRNGRSENVKFLIGAQADPTVVTKEGKTSLILATIDGSSDLLTYLLGIKAVKALVTEKDALGATALHYAVKDGFVNIMKQLMDRNARVNAKDGDGRQALMFACQYGHIDCVRLLHKKAAEINGQDKNKRTPLMYACLFNKEAVALFLYGKCKADPELEDNNQDKPLDIANDQGMVQFKNAIKRNFHADAD